MIIMADDTRERYINPYTDFGFKKVFWDNYSVIKTAREKGVLEGIQQGVQQGIQQGVQKGILKEKGETVQRMKAKGFSIEDISEIAGLTIEEVKKLLQ